MKTAHEKKIDESVIECTQDYVDKSLLLDVPAKSKSAGSACGTFRDINS